VTDQRLFANNDLSRAARAFPVSGEGDASDDVSPQQWKLI
jgi:hypothetical protein